MRRTGIEVIGDVSWGTHFCQFYQDKQDLIDILVPYFAAGLAENEFCMWITSEPLGADEAAAALAVIVGDLTPYLQSHQLEILSYDQWYTLDGTFASDRVLQGWVDKLAAARERGFAGLRLTGNTFWLEASDWQDFTDYEAAVDSVIGRYPMLAMCTYSLERCGAVEIMDVVSNHAFALIKRTGSWQIIESTERKKVEASLRESEARYRSLFNGMTEGFALHEIICDERGVPYDYRFLEINPAFERLTGLRQDDIIGRTVREVLPATEDFWVERYGKVALTGEAVHFENYSSALDRHYEVFAYRPAPGQFAVLFIDITDRKRAEEQQRILLHMVSHDLRAPMAIINGHTELMLDCLNEHGDTELMQSSMEAIRRGVQRMNAMVDDLTDVARLEGGQLQLACKPLAVGSYLADLLQRSKSVLDLPRFAMEVPDDLPPVLADADRLDRVLTNLLTNAQKYSDPGTVVRVHALSDQREVVISVTDQGPGISPEDLPHLFSRFYRTKRTRRADSIGLGLYITRLLVEAHAVHSPDGTATVGGRIWVESEPNQGSTFHFSLPVV